MNTTIDQAFAAIGTEVDVAYHARCSAEEIPLDEQVIVGASGAISHMGSGHYVTDFELLLSTPGMAGEAEPEDHSTVSGEMLQIVSDSVAMASLFDGGASLELAGSFLREMQTSVDEGRWVTTFSLRIGVRQI